MSLNLSISRANPMQDPVDVKTWIGLHELVYLDFLFKGSSKELMGLISIHVAGLITGE